MLSRQFITRNRRMAFVLAVAIVAIGVATVHLSEWWFSPGVIILPILAGGLLLWVRALRVLFVIAAAAVAYDIADHRAGPGIVATIAVTAAFADVLARTRAKLGLQGLRGDQMLIELRDRIREQGKLPPLGDGWGSDVVLRPAGGASFGGDFVVSYSDGKTLEVALVDVSGKGIDAGTRALLLSGALGGLLGSVPRTDFLAAANAYLRRGRWSEGFVTAVHLSLDLTSGEYVIASAGHPPGRALRGGQRPVARHPGTRHRPRRRARPAGRADQPGGGRPAPRGRPDAVHRWPGRGPGAGHRRRHRQASWRGAAAGHQGLPGRCG